MRASIVEWQRCSRLPSFCVRINGLNVCGGAGIDVVLDDGRPTKRLNTLDLGRSLTKIGRGAATLPSLPPSPSDFRRNEFAAAVGVRTSVPGTRVRGQFAAEYRRFEPR